MNDANISVQFIHGSKATKNNNFCSNYPESKRQFLLYSSAKDYNGKGVIKLSFIN